MRLLLQSLRRASNAEPTCADHRQRQQNECSQKSPSYPCPNKQPHSLYPPPALALSGSQNSTIRQCLPLLIVIVIVILIIIGFLLRSPHSPFQTPPCELCTD